MLAPPPLGSWRPLLGEILDPPLVSNVTFLVTNPGVLIRGSPQHIKGGLTAFSERKHADCSSGGSRISKIEWGRQCQRWGR